MNPKRTWSHWVGMIEILSPSSVWLICLVHMNLKTGLQCFIIQLLFVANRPERTSTGSYFRSCFFQRKFFKKKLISFLHCYGAFKLDFLQLYQAFLIFKWSSELVLLIILEPKDLKWFLKRYISPQHGLTYIILVVLK